MKAIEVLARRHLLPSEVRAATPVIPVPNHSRWVIIALALLYCTVAGCGGPHADIVGKWRAAGDASAPVWEFTREGIVVMGTTRGKYTFGDSDRVKIQTPFGTSVYQMVLSEDHMTLRDPSGSKLEFTRLK